LISSKIGDRWITHLEDLRKLEQFADDPEFQTQWQAGEAKLQVCS
jgi:starch phosphorylase